MVAAGVHVYEERLHVARALVGGQREELERPGPAAGLEDSQAGDRFGLVRAGDDRSDLDVVVEQRAEPHAERPRDLDQRRERRDQLAGLDALDDHDVAVAAFRQLFTRKAQRLAYGRDLRPDPGVRRHALSAPFTGGLARADDRPARAYAQGTPNRRPTRGRRAPRGAGGATFSASGAGNT